MKERQTVENLRSWPLWILYIYMRVMYRAKNRRDRESHASGTAVHDSVPSGDGRGVFCVRDYSSYFFHDH